MKLDRNWLHEHFFHHLSMEFFNKKKELVGKYKGWRIGIIDQVGFNQFEVVSDRKVFKIHLFSAGGTEYLKAALPNPLCVDEAFRIVLVKSDCKNKEDLYEKDFIFAGKIWFNHDGSWTPEWYK